MRPVERQVLVDGAPVPLGARAFDVLLVLIERRGALVTKRELLELVWPDVVVEENNLQVQISLLRKLLGQQVIVTIPGQGYRFALPVDEPNSRPSTTVPQGSDGAVTGSSPRLSDSGVGTAQFSIRDRAVDSSTASQSGMRSRQRLAIGAIVSVVLAAMLGTVFWPHKTVESPPADRGALRVAVLPFRSQSPDDRELAEATQRSLRVELGSSDWIAVVAPLAAEPARKDGEASESISDSQTFYRIEGEVRSAHDKAVILLRLIDGQNSTQLWSREFEHRRNAPLLELGRLQARIASASSAALMDAGVRRAMSQRDPKTPVDFWLRAWGSWDARRLNEDSNTNQLTRETARNYFHEAIRLDPRFTTALVDLANSYNQEYFSDPRNKKVLQQWDEASARAMHSDPNGQHHSAWAQRSLALAFTGRLAEALAANDKLLELRPHHAYPLAIRASFLTLMGRPEQAEVLLNQAIDMSPPGSSFTLRWLCMARLLAGRADDALPICERAAAEDSYWPNQIRLIVAYVQTGSSQKAATAKAALLRQRNDPALIAAFFTEISKEPDFVALVEKNIQPALRHVGLAE